MKPRAWFPTLVLAARAAMAGVPVCDFETDADLATLRWASRGESTLARVAEFASHGASSLLFRSPAWNKGQPEQLAAARAAILSARLKAGGPEIKARLDDLERRTARIEKDLGSGAINLAKLGTLGDELAAIPQQAARRVAITRFQQQCAEAGRPAAGLLVGLATSMEKIPPRAAGFEMRPATKVELSLARNE